MQATELDHSDALRAFRERFHLPRTNGREQAYFCGNSLGLMPRSARDQVEEVLQQWSAEGVEAREQVTILLGLGCDRAQGFHYSKPLPLEQLLAWISERRVRRTPDIPAQSSR